jgi:hypothetical protein
MTSYAIPYLARVNSDRWNFEAAIRTTRCSPTKLLRCAIRFMNAAVKFDSIPGEYIYQDFTKTPASGSASVHGEWRQIMPIVFCVLGSQMNQLVIDAARRHVAEIEKRVAQQWALVEQLVSTNREASQATRTLRSLEQTLLLTREHVQFLLR